MQLHYTCGTHTTDILVCSAAHLIVSEDVLICSCSDAIALNPIRSKVIHYDDDHIMRVPLDAS